MAGTNSNDLAPIETVTADDHGGYIVLATYLSLLIALLFYIGRILGRLRVSRPNFDDWFLTAGMVSVKTVTRQS